MKPLLLHGPAISASRKKLIEIKQKFDPNNVVIFEKGVGLDAIIGSLKTVSMFDDERLIVVENPPEDLLSELPTAYQLPTAILLWYDHEVKKFPRQAQVFFFPETEEFSVFPFLNKLGAKDANVFWEMYKLKKAGFENQYIITMIFYLLRNLVATPKDAKEFVKKKNAKMRGNFSLVELVNIYKFSLEVDFKVKCGLLEENQAEFLLVNKFLK